MHNPNPIVKSVIIVTVFWYVVIAVFPLLRTLDIEMWFEYMPVLFDAAPSFATHSLKIVGLGAITGCASIFILHLMGLGEALHSIRRQKFRGATLTIGDFPRGAPLPKRKHTPASESPSKSIVFDSSAVEFGDSELDAWWRLYAEANPLYARLFAAIDGTLLASPRTPASPVPGGHGGATLLQHSRSVLKMTLRHAKDFEWVGHRNKKGTITYHPSDATYSFDESDPLIPIIAYSHDIGKLWCYEVQKDGSVQEVRSNHATVGATLLRLFPELWELSLHERETVIYAIKYYHSISRMPLSIGDHPRALAELLIAADIATGMMEGEANIVTRFLDSEGETLTALPAHIVSIQAESAASPKPTATAPQATTAKAISTAIAAQPHRQVKQADVSSPSENDLSTQTIKFAASLPKISNFAPKRVEFRNDVAHWVSCLLQLLLDGNNLKANTADRMAIKCDGWIYIFDAEMRTRMAKISNFPKLLEQQHEGHIAEVTKILLKAIDETGCLLTAINGNRFNAQSSVFNIAIKNKKGGNGATLRGVIIIHESFDERLKAIQEARTGSVEIIENLWKKARILKSKPVETNDNIEHANQQVEDAEPSPSITTENSPIQTSAADMLALATDNENKAIDTEIQESHQPTEEASSAPISTDETYDILLNDALAMAGLTQASVEETTLAHAGEQLDEDQLEIDLPEPEEQASEPAEQASNEPSAGAEILANVCEKGEVEVEIIDTIWNGGKPKDGLDPLSILEHYANPCTHTGMAANSPNSDQFTPVSFELKSGNKAKFLRYPTTSISEIHIEELQRHFDDDLFDNDQAKLKTHTKTMKQFLFVRPKE